MLRILSRQFALASLVAGAATTQAQSLHTLDFEDLARPPAGSTPFATPLVGNEYLGYGIYINGGYLWRDPVTGNQSLLGTASTQITFVGFAPNDLDFTVRTEPDHFLNVTAMTVERIPYGVARYPTGYPLPPFYDPTLPIRLHDDHGFSFVALGGSNFPSFGALIDNFSFTTGPVPAVPEAPTAFMLAAGMGLLWLRRRRVSLPRTSPRTAEAAHRPPPAPGSAP